MDPDLHLTHRRVNVHAAELHRQAELHRLAASGRGDRTPEPSQQSTLPITSPVPRIGRIVQRVTAVFHSTGPATALNRRRHLIR